MPFWFMASYVLMLVIGVGLGIWLYRRDVSGKNGKHDASRRFFGPGGERE